MEDLEQKIVDLTKELNLKKALSALHDLKDTRGVMDPATPKKEYDHKPLEPEELENSPLPKFLIAILSDQILRFSNPDSGKRPSQLDLLKILKLIYRRYRYDPNLNEDSSQNEIEDWDVFLYFIRQHVLQNQYNLDPYGNHTRNLALFSERRLDKCNQIDFNSIFKNIFKVELNGFVNFAYVIRLPGLT